jgi:acetyl-CoA acetyltransferase family protein
MAAYIVAAARTATGKQRGALRNAHPATLSAAVIDHILASLPSLDPADVDDVILGCVSQCQEQGGNIARHAVLSSTLPISVPGTTIDRQCGSSQQAIHFAAQAVMSGTQDIVVAGGVESMTRIPMFSNMPGDKGGPVDAAIAAKFSTKAPFFSQFVGAEMMGVEFGVRRDEMDAFAARSHARAAAAQAAGVFDGEIVPVDGVDKDGAAVAHAKDEGVRAGTTAEKLGSLDTLVELGVAEAVAGGPELGAITAGNASQISDGAAALLVVNDAGLKKLGSAVTPLARVHSLAVAANDPVLMLSAPIPATEKLLARAGVAIGDVDVYEVNEAFAVVPMAWAKRCGADEAKLNIHGGACALGHPLGATGAKLATTLVHTLQREEKRFGLLAICEGAGTANATLFERC